jgi:hypothetical protein
MRGSKKKEKKKMSVPKKKEKKKKKDTYTSPISSIRGLFKGVESSRV